MRLMNRASAETIKNADETEIAALRDGFSPIDQGISDDIIAGGLDTFMRQEETQQEPWAEKGLTLDSAVSELAAELERRAGILGDKYPFVISGNSIKLDLKNVNGLVYAYCLCLSYIKNKSTGESRLYPRIFEKISALAVQMFFGPTAKSIRTGWPREDGLPKSFVELAKHLEKETGQFVFQPVAGAPALRAVHLKDAGIDFVVYMRHVDNSPAALVVLGQSAVGRNWSGKYEDINVVKLGNLFQPLTWAKPVKAFTVPFCVTQLETDSASLDVGAVFYERIRVSYLSDLVEGQVKLISQMRRMLNTFVGRELPALPDAAG